MGRYKRGDFVKIEVPDEATNVGEWMWLIVDHSDDEKRLVIRKLDNEPIVNTDMRLGVELAVSYDKVREHMTASSFDR